MNCFQNRIFALSFTTISTIRRLVILLWIAFRIVSLHYLLQLIGLAFPVDLSCELLSESYLCIIFYNREHWVLRIFMLWIAFRIVSLHYLLQLAKRSRVSRSRCELLSESYLCIIFYNAEIQVNTPKMVVNCFQNRIFALSFTTANCPLVYRGSCELLSESYLCIIFYNGATRATAVSMLWIAFRIVSLHYLLQHWHKQQN